MSKENEVALLPYADFTMKDLKTIQEFKDEGLIGLAGIDTIEIEKAMALYMDGKTYRQISSTLKVKKDIILWAADKYKWYEMRQQYLEELAVTMPQKVIESKLQSQEFFLHLILAYQRKIGRNIDKYLKTNDESWHDKIDVKDVQTIMKLTELLHKLDNESFKDPQNDKSLVSLNGMGDGVTITKTGENSVEITPKSPFSNKLKAFADMKRNMEKENQAPKKTNDIVSEDNLTPKEEKNEI